MAAGYLSNGLGANKTLFPQNAYRRLFKAASGKPGDVQHAGFGIREMREFFGAGLKMYCVQRVEIPALADKPGLGRESLQIIQRPYYPDRQAFLHGMAGVGRLRVFPGFYTVILHLQVFIFCFVVFPHASFMAA